MYKQQIKTLVIMIALVCLFRIHPAFAAEGEPTWTMELFNTILKFLSWGWMLLAFLAGKLMSNDFVYGTFIHLDSALFKLWNYMKNIANFILGFIFLFGILKTFFDPKSSFDIKKVLPKYLLAGVLIQMSWFMMGAFVDLANIATAAVGAFPQQFIQGSTDNMSKNKMMQLAVTVPTKVEVSFQSNGELFKVYTGTQNIEDMFGKFNDMSGPLMFMGSSIFRFQDYDTLNQDITSWKNFSIALFIKLFLLIAFCVPLLILIVINLIRIFRLRIWIAFAPLASIVWAMDKEAPGFLSKIGDRKSLGFSNLSDVLSLIFQPVVMIGTLALVMIMSIGMYYVMGGDPGNQQSGTSYREMIENTEFSADGDSSTLKDFNSGSEITIDGDLFKGVGNFVGGMVGYLILTGFTVVLLRSLLKVSKDFSVFTKDAANNIFKWSEKLVSNANIVPFGGKMTSLAAMNKVGTEMKDKYIGGGYYAQKVTEQTDKLMTSLQGSGLGKTIQKTFGADLGAYATNDINPSEQNELRLAATSSVDKILQTIRNNIKKKNVTARSSNFRSSFNTLMNQNEGFRKFMLEGAGITPEEWDKNKGDILNASGDVGVRMRRFLAYALNKADIKEGAKIDANDVKDTLSKNFNTQDILPSTPLMSSKTTPDKEEKTEK